LNESLLAELANFKEQDLFEINMGSKNLRREAAKTGAIAGMEFEMIVPNVEGDNDGDQEPDYDYDQRCRSIQDAYDFFYDGDWNSRRSCDEMRNKMQEDFQEWIDEKLSTDWDSQGEEYTYQWVKENVDESEWNPEDKSDLGRTEALEEFAANVHADPMSDYYQSAYEEFREENEGAWDESDWLDDADLSRMSEIENAYSMSWPHWTSPQGGEANISDVAQEFENAIERDVRASDNYHSGSTLRPSVANQRYVVEPDGSLEPDDPNDRGLEFVSPPLPIDEILSDLNKVKAWANEYGCYTNDSTGLHINISVPDYSREKLDFVKLALLMGDKYVLDLFGRSSNTYAKSALDIVKKAVRDNPADAAKLLDKMKGNMDQLATKAIHSGSTSKYTSINTKDGHIEFRSPGGDWLNENFDKIENTLLRFTVAMSAALNPDAYREEYLKKLYKLLSENNKGDDTIKYFSDYVAGKIPKAALRSFVKQAQLQRNIKRGKTDGQKMWWKVYKDGKNAGRYSPTIEVVATSEKEAIDKAAKEWGEPLLVNTLARMDAEVLRPYVEQPAKSGSGTYELFDRRTGETIPDTEFSSRNDADVQTRLDDYINHGQHGMDAIDARLVFGARPVAAPADEPEEGVLDNSLRPTGPGPWEVYNRQTGNSVINLDHNGQPMTDRSTAQQYAMDSLDPSQYDNYGVRTRGTGSRANIGTQTDMENRLGLPSQSATANYAVVDRQTLDPVFRFQAGNRRDANGIYGEWLAAAGLPQTTEDYGFQEIRPEIPEVPMDVAQNFSDRTDGRNIDYSFRDLFGTTDQASSAPAGNSFSGQWRVMIDGEEVWRFRGPAGEGQANANRIAQLWYRDQISQGLLSPAEGADLEVVPVMTESVQESLTEIAPLPANTFSGGKDMLGMFQTPAKKHLKPLPGGTDLQYAIETNRYGSIVQIVDPGMPGITRPEVVAVLNLEPVQYYKLPNTVQVGSITVDEDYRGRGLAKALYGIVLTIMRKNLVSGSGQTPGGRRNWLSLASIPGVEVRGLVRITNQVFDMNQTATVTPQYKKYADRTMDQIMELGGQFFSQDDHSNYWLFDVVPGKGSLQPAVKNALSRLYGYDSDNLLLATWTGA
jgi:GNAT superfamily N-acetyltransferase